MCMYIKPNLEAKVVRKDQVVYKLVEQDEDNKESLRSFFQFTRINIGDTYKSAIRVNYNRIDIGLHSYPSKKNAIYAIENDTVTPGFIGIVVKCIIPKGSVYYNGTYINYEKSITCKVSNKIIYTNEIVYTLKD